MTFTAKSYHGFKYLSSSPVKSIKAVIHQFVHEKSGAKLAWLDREEENKSFAITFKTVPQDSTGVFHILEHSVLCGSDKYPVKEPFVELMKGSLNTFLNALTFPDKTMYPVASCNDKDFLNLVSVYMDAVLHPMIYSTPEIFYQEGWHYDIEGKDSEATYKGVVFNEMKGAYASAERLLGIRMSEILFPDNCYGFSSGGDPEHIPDLTYEQFIAAHKRFYHPSNAMIFLDGSINFDGTFELLDSFLAPYDVTEPNTDIPMQKPVPAATVRMEYEVGKSDPLENKTLISFGSVAGTFRDREENNALRILATALAGSNDSPLTKAVLGAGLAEDLTISIDDDGAQQTAFQILVRNTEESKLDEIRKVIRTTLESLCDGKLDHEDILASLNRMEFSVKEHDFGNFPSGIVFAIAVMSTWLYGGDPKDALETDEVFSFLRSKIDSGYFEDLIRKYFLNDARIVTVIACPSHTVGDENAQRERERLSKAKASWSDEETDLYIARNKDLVTRQGTPDSPEALATVPQLTLGDLPASLPVSFPKEETVGGVTLLRHSKTNEGIVYLSLYFDASDIPLEELSPMSFATDLFTQLDTEDRSALELQKAIRSDLGKLSVSLTHHRGGLDISKARVYLAVRCSALEQKAETAVSLILETVKKTLLDESQNEKIRAILQQEKTSNERYFVMSGHAAARTRLFAYTSASGVASEYMDGYEYLQWLKETEKKGEEGINAFRAVVKKNLDRILDRSRLLLSVSGGMAPSLIESLTKSFGMTGKAPAPASYKPLGIRREGIQIPAPIAFTCVGSNLYTSGIPYSGGLRVAAKLLSLNYLWLTVRVKGGAYGSGLSAERNGAVSWWSYRDPNPANTVRTDRESPAFLREFAGSGEPLDQIIIGSVADLLPYETAMSAVGSECTRYFNHVTAEEMQKVYGEMLAVRSADLKTVADEMEKVLSDGAAVVISSQEKLEECKKAGLIDTILQL